MLEHVKAWLKPNLHKIRKTVITLKGFGLIFEKPGSMTNLNVLNILRPIKSDNISHVTILNCFVKNKNN